MGAVKALLDACLKSQEDNARLAFESVEASNEVESRRLRCRQIVVLGKMNKKDDQKLKAKMEKKLEGANKSARGGQ